VVKRLHPLDPEKISSGLPYGLAAGLHVFDQVDSTNLWLMDHLRGLPSEVSIRGRSCFTDEQTKGRGRRGRVWKSIAGDDITFSMAWSYTETDPAGALTLATAVSVAETLEGYCKQRLSIKWPNDIYCHDRKLVGILAEATGRPGVPRTATLVVIGVGVNLGQSGSTDLNRIGLLDLISSVDRNELAAKLLSDLAKSMEKFEQVGLAGFTQAYNERDYLRNRSVIVRQQDGIWTGTAIGLADDGALNILDESDTKRQVHAADVTIRWQDGSTD